MNITQIEPPVFVISTQVPKAEVAIGTPNKADYYKLISHSKCLGIIEKYALTELPPLTETTSDIFVKIWLEKMSEYRQNNMDFMCVPEKTDFSYSKKDKDAFPVITIAEHVVYEHTGLNFADQLELPITEYWLLLADALKMKMSETEKGREYLRECYNDMHEIRTLGANV